MPFIGDRSELNLNAVIYATDFSVCFHNAGLYSAVTARYFSAKLMAAHAFTLPQAALEVSGAFQLIVDSQCPVLTVTG
jgi:hypothetical protein